MGSKWARNGLKSSNGNKSYNGNKSSNQIKKHNRTKSTNRTKCNPRGLASYEIWACLKLFHVAKQDQARCTFFTKINKQKMANMT